jgi:very-short-patch-repair endonuclease
MKCMSNLGHASEAGENLDVPELSHGVHVPTRERQLADLATRQHGVVARRQLEALGLKRGAIAHRLKLGRLQAVHSGVYAVGHRHLSQRSHWVAAVLACGEGAVLSHRSAAALWGLLRPRGTAIDVTSPRGRAGRRGIAFHECQLNEHDRTMVDSIPVTTVPRTLFDLSEVVDSGRLQRAWEEADRLGRLQLRTLEAVIDRGWGRHALKPIAPLAADARHAETTRSPLEDRFAAFCREHRLPPPMTNVEILDHEVDAYWPAARLVVEADSFEFHGHRAAFERDRARDAAMQAAGYRVVRLTHRRLENEPTVVAAQLSRLLQRQA